MMGLIFRLIFVIIRPVYALFLTIGAVIGVAASVIIMNLLVGYFSVASDAYTSVHPHVVVHGVWPAGEAASAVARIERLSPEIVRAAPALHFNRTISLASVKVISDFCHAGRSLEDSCGEQRNIADATRRYAYDVGSLSQVDVQVRGITVVDGDTVASYRKVIAGSTDLGRLVLDKDENSNALPIAFIAQDTLISDPTGNFLMSAPLLADRFERYYRLHGVIRLGAKSSGAPLLVLGLEQAKALAPDGKGEPNAIELRLANPLSAGKVAKLVQQQFGPAVRVETWIDKERPAFEFLNATWVMVFSVMLSICLVVAISIYSTLTLSILRNRWKVALLGSLGVTTLGISLIFLSFAVLIALAGIFGGVAVGHFASQAIGGTLYKAFLNLPPERFAATITLLPAAWMSAATLAIFIASAMLPARQAIAIRPADALSGRQ